ncbi:prostacyclin synthase [Diplocarpon rosae]|nr:prostacyclin synthase [Diplocarpon rosae]
MSASLITAGLVAVLSLAVVMWFFGDASAGLDPQEPRPAHSRIPYVGHMINLLRHHNAYFSMLHAKQPHPITTLKILSQRIYIISSPALVQAAFRASKTVDFEIIKATASCRAVNFSKQTTAIVQAPPDPARGNSNYMLDLHREMYGALMGEDLLETNAKLLNCLAAALNRVGSGWEEKQLFRWLRTFYSVASAEALYGASNPIQADEKLVPMIWDFEKELGLLVLDVFPAITARKGHTARVTMTTAFEKYPTSRSETVHRSSLWSSQHPCLGSFRRGGNADPGTPPQYNAGLSKNASGFIKGRERCARKWGMTTIDIAQADISILFAAVTNTVPNVYFMICYIFSDPRLLAVLRSEAEGIVRREGAKVVLSIGALRERCPLLTACFQETLRLVKTGASVRVVLEDTMLGEKYLLKKGGVVQIPTGLLQSDPATWGPEAKEFDPYRWTEAKTTHKEDRDRRKVQSQAFVPFGGGKNLCPGRHLAFNEITAFVAMVVWGFDIRGGDGKTLEAQRGGLCNLGDGSTSPKGDLDVCIRRREGFEGLVFEFDVGGVVAE